MPASGRHYRWVPTPCHRWVPTPCHRWVPTPCHRWVPTVGRHALAPPPATAGAHPR
ncbi:hypothetical protein D7Y37_01600 [Stenotrophomonas maltophilia]|nr:hypothetical protein [Stenotrophomonas maltophilia]